MSLATFDLPLFHLGNEIFFKSPFPITNISTYLKGYLPISPKLLLVLLSVALRHSCHLASYVWSWITHLLQPLPNSSYWRADLSIHVLVTFSLQVTCMARGSRHIHPSLNSAN